MHFVKMHGIGNDYVYLDAFTNPALAERPDLPDLARRMSDRHTGVGSDGLILVCRANASPTNMWGDRLRGPAHVRMRMFNADGSESEMCGNGVRCVAKFAHDRLGVRANPMLVETGRGFLEIGYETDDNKLSLATVDMGGPIRTWAKIPVDEAHFRSEDWSSCHLEVDGRRHSMVFVSMGNPHAVKFVDDPDAVDLTTLGPKVEHHPAFPKRINYHVAKVARPGEPGPNEIWMRTWERGSGITLACGTGACAVAVAAVWCKLVDDDAPHLVHLPGGDLTITPQNSNGGTTHQGEPCGTVLMTGPATDVFEGEWPE